MGGKHHLRRADLLYPDLSFEINGVLFDVFKQLGGGHNEKYYQKAVAIGLESKKLKFSEQHYAPLNYQGKQIGKYFLDFLIEDIIILELKRGQFVPAQAINQTKGYLDSLSLQLALVACFTHTGVFIKRIINQRKIS